LAKWRKSIIVCQSRNKRDESGNRAARSREAAGRNLPQSSVSRNNFELKKTVKFSLAAA
jgi:hypothetical protein